MPKTASPKTASPRDRSASAKQAIRAESGVHGPAKSWVGSKLKPGPAIPDKENEKVRKEMAKIDAMELSDIESPEWAAAKQKHVETSQKRQRDVETIENVKRKVCI